MDRGLTVFILLGLGVAAQTATTRTVLRMNVYTRVSVVPSQLETTQIVSRPLISTRDVPLRFAITVKKNETRCMELSIDPCPDPELLVTVFANTSYNAKTYNYSRTLNGGVQLKFFIDNGINITSQDMTAEEGQALLYLDYSYTGIQESLNTGGNTSYFNIQLITVTTVTLPNGGENGGHSGSRNGQPALYHRGLLGIIALMLFPLFLLS